MDDKQSSINEELNDVLSSGVEPRLQLVGYNHKDNYLTYRLPDGFGEKLCKFRFKLSLVRSQFTHYLVLECSDDCTGCEPFQINVASYQIEEPKGLTQLDKDVRAVLKYGEISEDDRRWELEIHSDGFRDAFGCSTGVTLNKTDLSKLYELLTAARGISTYIDSRMELLCEQRELGNESVEDEIVALDAFQTALTSTDQLGQEG